GQAFQVTLTVTNNGGASALAVSAALWQFNGTATANISPSTPGVVASLAAGGWTSYTWTVTATGAGSLGLTGSATGTGPVVSNLPAVVVGVDTPAVLAAAISLVPTTVCLGQAYQVRLTLTNTGSAAMTGLGL